MTKKFFMAAALASVLASCNPGRVYQDRVSLAPDMVWDMNNVLVFEADIQDASLLYDINVELRTVDYYPNANMWLFIKTTSPSGAAQQDTMECILRDEKGFSTSETMRFGEVEDYEIPFREAVRFSENGKYKFEVRHGMRMEKLPFVNEVGLSVDIHKN